MDTYFAVILLLCVCKLDLNLNCGPVTNLLFNLEARKERVVQYLNMDEQEKTRVKWTPQMLIDLLCCKKEAQEEMKQNKQQRGLRNVMFRRWNEMGYEHLQLSAQNLYDRAAKAERSSKTLREHMEEQRSLSQRAQTNNLNQTSEAGLENFNESTVTEPEEVYANQQESQTTREQNSPTPETNEPATMRENNGECLTLFNKATEVYNEIYNEERDFNKRQWSTKTRKIPTTKEQRILNEVSERLISTMEANSPEIEPEQNLWKLNCITYSIAVAWRYINSEIKENTEVTRSKDQHLSNVEKKIVQTRQLLSKASAEREAIQNRAKMTKRRKLISLECKSLSVKDLTEFIDKLKHRLKNLTRQNKQQKARQLQRKWDNALQSDPGSVFKHLAKSLEKNKEEKPRLSQDEKKFE